MKINLSLSGGGIKGIAHLGALKALEENNIEIAAIAGSSVGAIIASLYGAGYSSIKLKEIIYEQDFAEFRDGFLLNLYRLIFRYGIYKGNRMLTWLEDKLFLKGVETFSDLEKDVRIISANINKGQDIVFSKKQTPDFSVAQAVRMSVSIPVFYEPYFEQDDFYVDGGLINNLPLTEFKNSSRPTLGLLLVNSGLQGRKEINNFLDYLGVIIETTISVNEQRQIELSRSKVIAIPTKDISSINFSIPISKKKQLYNCGYKQIYKDIEKFKDRRLLARRAQKKTDLNPTIVEMEEKSELMIDYILKRVKISKIDGIVGIGEEDYLFSFLVAQRLNKKFTVFNLDKQLSSSKSKYRYDSLGFDSNIIVVTFSILDQNKLRKLVDDLKNKQVNLQAIFNFFTRARNNVILKSFDIPIYNYNYI